MTSNVWFFWDLESSEKEFWYGLTLAHQLSQLNKSTFCFSLDYFFDYNSYFDKTFNKEHDRNLFHCNITKQLSCAFLNKNRIHDDQDKIVQTIKGRIKEIWQSNKYQQIVLLANNRFPQVNTIIKEFDPHSIICFPLEKFNYAKLMKSSFQISRPEKQIDYWTYFLTETFDQKKKFLEIQKTGFALNNIKLLPNLNCQSIQDILNLSCSSTIGFFFYDFFRCKNNI